MYTWNFGTLSFFVSWLDYYPIFVFLAEKFLMVVGCQWCWIQSIKSNISHFYISFLMQGHSVQGNSKLARF